MSKIASVEAFEAKVPLPEPVVVGSTVFKVRTYTVVRVRCSDGLEGVGYCYSRGLPIKEIVINMIAPVVIGKDIENSEEIRSEVLATFWHSAEHGTFTAAVSAVDIAIWDALGKASNKSVAQMLGKKKDQLPVSYVINSDATFIANSIPDHFHSLGVPFGASSTYNQFEIANTLVYCALDISDETRIIRTVFVADDVRNG